MVECITLKPTWQGGVIVPAGEVVSLPESDAAYAESIGRVERVIEPPKPAPKRKAAK